MNAERELLHAFLRGEVDNRSFHHADHVRVGFELLRRHAFPVAVATFCAALKEIAARAGNPRAYHETITVAFLALIAEHMTARDYPDFETFAAANPELMDRQVLGRWYRVERLQSDVARRTFILPDAANHSGAPQ
jgi:hypothetical protein